MGLVNDIFGGGDDEAQKYLQQALQQYQSINVPTVAQGEVNNLPQETVQGTINPNEIQTAEQAPTEFNNIALDPSTRQAQINALTGYQDIANSGGLDASAKLGIQQAIDQANIQSQGAQGAIQNQAQAMGQGGGNFALTQRALAAQGASNNAATQGLQQAAEAEANREAALNGMANIGGAINAADYSQAANKAASQNTINASNTAAKNAANTGNVANNLTAQTANLQNAQNVNASNTAANQGNAYYNAGLTQQQFNNELSKANGMAGVNQAQASAANQASQNSANATGQLLKGGIGAGATLLSGPVGGALASGAISQGYQNGPPKSANTNQYSPMGYSDGGEVCMAEGGEAHNHYLCMLMGGKVPGEPNVKGDSAQNDTVPAMLSPGEIVVKRSKASNPESAAKEAKKISLEHFSKKGKR